MTLTDRQQAVLHAVDGTWGTLQGIVANMAARSRAAGRQAPWLHPPIRSVQGLLVHLRGLGLVEHEPSPGGVGRWRLTDEGAQLLGRIRV